MLKTMMIIMLRKPYQSLRYTQKIHIYSSTLTIWEISRWIRQKDEDVINK